MSIDDPDYQLALELSKQSFAQEQLKRSGEEDLIRFEAAENPEQRTKINNIKRLFSQPSLDQCTSTPPSAGWIPNFSSSYQPTSYCQTLPAVPYSLVQASSYSGSTPFQTAPSTPQPFGPSSSHGGSFPPRPTLGFLNDTFQLSAPPPPPLPPRLNRQRTIESQHPPPRPPKPITPNSDRLYPIIYPSPQASDTLLHPPRPSSARSGSSLYDYIRNDHYVPYAMISRHIDNGDLIDLGSSDDREKNCSSVTIEQIRREFDPLYLLVPSKETAIMPSLLSSSHYKKDVEAEVPAIKAVQPSSPKSNDDKENINQWLSLDQISLQSHTPSTISQVDVLKNKGLRYLSDSSPLHFKASTADYMTTSAKSVKVVISTDYTWPDSQKKVFSITCDTETTVDMIITQVLSELLPESELSEGVSIGAYGLKIYGLDEYMPDSSIFGHNIYVGQCLLQGNDVKLEVGLKSNKIQRSSSPVPEFESIKPHIKFSSVVDREDIDNFKVQLEQEMKRYEEVFLNSATLTVSTAANKVRGCVKMLCKFLNSIEPVSLHKHLQNYLTATTKANLNSARNDLIASLHAFISVYCLSTMSAYNVTPLKEPIVEKKEIIQCTDKLRIMVNSIHNLPNNWIGQYKEFYITVSIYYGTQLLEELDRCIAKQVKHDAFFPYVPMDLVASFNYQLCMCARETKILIMLSGVEAQPPGPEVTNTKKTLAFASIPLFDHLSNIRQGQMFIPLTVMQNAVVRPWGPHPLIANQKEANVIVTLPTYDYQVQFPDVAVDYQSAPQDLSTLPMETQELLLNIIETGDTQKLSSEELEVLWQKRMYLLSQPEALPLVLSAVSDWGFAFLSSVYQILEDWVPPSPVEAMQLLLPQFPDARVRAKAIEWILLASSEFLFNSLPQLVEALRFELFECSSLAVALLTLSYKDRRFAFELYWALQQRIDHVVDFAYAHRCCLLQKELVKRHEDDCLRYDIAGQHKLLNWLDCLQMELRSEDNDQARIALLRTRLGVIDGSLLQHNVRLPILPSFKCSGIRVRDCSIYNSNAKPLKIVFMGLNDTYPIIHKSGDDMRQDALVLQLVGLMNDIWLADGLDLRMILFRIMPVGYKKGMAQLIQKCSTLCDIQKEGGVTGVFKDDVLMNWLQKHNSSEFSYKMALDNFTRSCAGWCVATYVLGIGDRHNDNILVTNAGHVFHIDFGKYMGDWQMAAGFKRDRVPFVFTSEMYHVINGGNEQRESYQTFIDYCCRAFNALRRKYTILTNILKIMACSDIAGMNIKSLEFVQDNLMLNMRETDATMQLTQLINVSLKSAFPRINFFIHTLAQMMAGGSAKNNENCLSFVPQLYTQKMDGKILDVRMITFEKRMLPNKVYVYKMEVVRENEAVPTVVYRTFDEFSELYMKLRRRFPTVLFPVISPGTKMRSNVREVAQRRIIDIEQFLKYIFSLSPEIGHCDLVYTFFHLILRDSSIDSNNQNEDVTENPHGKCQIHLKISCSKNRISIFIGHVKYLSLLPSGQPPDVYVKTYLRPDSQNTSKQKTLVVRASQNPTFNQELSYDLCDENADYTMATRVLEVSVWNSGALMDNHRMYFVYIPLQKLKSQPVDRKGNRTLDSWFACDKS